MTDDPQSDARLHDSEIIALMDHIIILREKLDTANRKLKAKLEKSRG